MGGVNADLLAQLAAPHALPPPGWWPPAPGWWVLAALLLVLIATMTYRYRRRISRLRRAALAELGQLEGADDEIVLARGLEQLLRRYALARFDREQVARLSGEAWIAFVVAHGGAAWSGDVGRALLRAAYGGATRADRARWIEGARDFLNKARPAT
ncbi:MAG: DUF4381 domain-containing protein [Panacagrimonas sp.]